MDLFVPTIAYQLATFSPNFRRALGKRLDKDPLLAKALPHIQLKKLLQEPLEDIPPLNERCVIVVDALDECGERSELKRLMVLIMSCSELRGNITLFVTGRPEPEILHAISEDGIAPLVAIIDMDEVDPITTSSDILSYSRARLLRIQDVDDHSWRPRLD